MLKRRGGQATQKNTQMGKNIARKREYKEEEERMERLAEETRTPQRSKVSSRVEEGEFTGKCCTLVIPKLLSGQLVSSEEN